MLVTQDAEIGRPRRRAWPPSLREARAHAVIVATVLWVIAGVLLLTPGPRDALGRLKGRDFAFFYTLGHLARSGDGARLYDMDAERELRARLVSASASDGFASAYPPQTAMAFAPLAIFSYRTAMYVWMTATAVVASRE